MAGIKQNLISPPKIVPPIPLSIILKKTGFGGEVTQTVIVATVQVVVIAAVIAIKPPSVMKSVIICRSLTTALLIVGAIACTVAVANLGAASTTSSTTGMLMYSFPVLKVGLFFEY